jgi:hypothetical protein
MGHPLRFDVVGGILIGVHAAGGSIDALARQGRNAADRERLMRSLAVEKFSALRE